MGINSNIIVGSNAIREALKMKNMDRAVLYLLDNAKGKSKELSSLAFACKNIVVKKVDSRTLSKFSLNHKGAVLVCKQTNKVRKEFINIKDFCLQMKHKEKCLVLILDGITDPQNLGSIIRTADCFAVDLVVIPKNNSAKISSTVYSVSQGALSYVQLSESVNIVRDIEEFKKNGFWVYCADIKGESIYSFNFDSKTVIVMGREGLGLHQLVKQKCDQALTIPIQGHLDSLNVSVATGVIASEFRRKVGY